MSIRTSGANIGRRTPSAVLALLYSTLFNSQQHNLSYLMAQIKWQSYISFIIIQHVKALQSSWPIYLK